MAKVEFYRPESIRIKEEPNCYGDREGDVKAIKAAHCCSLYPDISFMPAMYGMMNYMQDKYMYLQAPFPKLEPDFMFPPTTQTEPEYKFTPTTKLEPDFKFPTPPSENYSPSTTNPFCKRTSLPLEKCPICKKYFRRMNTHMQKHGAHQFQPIVDSLACKYCAKVFSNLGNLSIHMRTHTGMKPYVCNVCSKGFAQSCNLTNHLRTHTGEKPFKCPYCDRAFTQSGNLSNHIRLHLDQKPFKCHFCERAFTQSGNLNSHIKNNHKTETIYN